MKKVLVLGATGNVGSLVAKELAEKGYSVKAAVRDIEKAQKILGLETELVEFSFEDSATYKTALENVSHIFAIAPPANPNSDEVVNPFIIAAKEAGVEHITMMTAMSEWGAIHLEKMKNNENIKVEVVNSGGWDSHVTI